MYNVYLQATWVPELSYEHGSTAWTCASPVLLISINSCRCIIQRRSKAYGLLKATESLSRVTFQHSEDTPSPLGKITTSLLISTMTASTSSEQYCNSTIYVMNLINKLAYFTLRSYFLSSYMLAPSLSLLNSQKPNLSKIWFSLALSILFLCSRYSRISCKETKEQKDC